MGKTKKKVSPVSALFVIIFALLALAVAVLPNYPEIIDKLPESIASNKTVQEAVLYFTYLNDYVTKTGFTAIIDSIKAGFGGFAETYLKNTETVGGAGDITLGTTLLAVSAIFLALTLVLSLIGMFCGKKAGRQFFALIAFLTSLGWVAIRAFVVKPYEGIVDCLYKDVTTGYFIYVGLTFVTFIFSLLGKKKIKA